MAEPVGVEDAVGEGAATVVAGEIDGVGVDVGVGADVGVGVDVAVATGGGGATLDAEDGMLVLFGADALGPGAA